MARLKAIQGQNLIKSPITSNGRDPIMGADGRIQYKETVAEAAARTSFEKINASRPTHLKFIIEDYNEKPVKAAKAEEDEEENTVKSVTAKRGPKPKANAEAE